MNTIDRILQLVKESKLTAKEYADKCGLGAGNITDWKTGRSKPSIESLQRIARYDNVYLEWLTGDTYFRNTFHYSYCMGFATSFLVSSDKKECAEIENEINRLLNSGNQYKFAVSIKEIKLDMLSDCPDHIKGKIEQFINTLYFDYLKNAYIYEVVYGVKKFQISTFLKNSIYKFNASKKINKTITNKLNELEDKYNVERINGDNSLNSHICPIYENISIEQEEWEQKSLIGKMPINLDTLNIESIEDCFFLKLSERKKEIYALIQKRNNVKNGDIVLVATDKNKATLNKFTKQGDIIVLESIIDNTIQILEKNKTVKIYGKYIGKFEIEKSCN